MPTRTCTRPFPKNKRRGFAPRVGRTRNMNDEKKKELWRTIKFTLFSISAGVIQFATTALMTEVFHTPTWIAYLTGLVLSVIWNFTLNRRYTFKSANNVPKAMLQVFLFYLIFTPVSTVLVGMLTEGIALPWDETRILVKGWDLVHPLVGTLIGMVLNFVTEFLYDRFVVFKDSLDTNEIAEKEKAAEESQQSQE